MRLDPRQRRSQKPAKAMVRAKHQRAGDKLEIRYPAARGKKRWAAQILRDVGLLDCPPGTVPSPELFREARTALGWTQRVAAWHLGFATRHPAPIARIEHNLAIPTRCTMLLLVRHLQQLDRRQRQMSVAAAMQPKPEGD